MRFRSSIAAALVALVVAPRPAQAAVELRAAAPRHVLFVANPPAAARPTARAAGGSSAQPQPASKLTGEWPVRPSGKTVTLEEKQSVDEALGEIAEAAGWNLVANTGRFGDRKLVVAVREAPVEEALEAVLEGSPLVATRRGNTVSVTPGEAAEQPVLSGFEKSTGKRFSGDFAETPVGDALRKVADAAGLSIVFPPGLRGTVNGHFREAPVEDVLRAILAQAGLSARREGSILTVSREAERSLVITGGKRAFAVQFQDEAAEPSGQAEGEPAPQRTDGGAKGGRHAGGRKKGYRVDADRVLQGDQVIHAGQRVKDVVVFDGNVRLEPGASAHQVTAILGSVEVGFGANVDREVVAIGGDVHVESGAHVGAEVVSIGGKIIVDEGAAVEGEQTSISVPGLGGILGLVGKHAGGTSRESASWRLGSALGEFAVFFLLGLLAFLIVPRRVESVTASIVNRPMKAVLTGVLATIALPLVVLLLIVTVVGIPFVAVVVLGLAAAAVMGYTALALYLGRALPFRFERGAPILHLAIGTAALVILGQIPVLGCLAWIAGWLFVFGVVLRTRFGQPPTAPPAVYGTTAPPASPPPPPAPPPATGTANP
jgi:Secretin and TonB N terminus short domain